MQNEIDFFNEIKRKKKEIESINFAVVSPET